MHEALGSIPSSTKKKGKKKLLANFRKIQVEFLGIVKMEINFV